MVLQDVRKNGFLPVNIGADSNYFCVSPQIDNYAEFPDLA
jgi:hypothetical protein